jgi:hypothetical protein
MTSLQTGMKQSRGYFLTTTALAAGYTYAASSGAGGSWVPGVMTYNTSIAVPVNSVLRDMGKTVVVGPLGTVAATATPTAGQNQRVFRKVQWVNHGRGVAASGLVNPANGVSSGTVGTDTATVGYDTFYIELPAAGQAGGASAVLATGVVYVPGLPGL